MRGWYGHRQQHSMASKGIKTISNGKGVNFYKCGNCNTMMQLKKLEGEDYWSCPNCGKRYYDYAEIFYEGKGRSVHGSMDRSWDEYLFTDNERENISVIVFSEPDWVGLKDLAEEQGVETDEEWDKFVKEEERKINEDGEVHVIWAGAVDFMGTEKEFANRYPELNRHLGLGLNADGILDAVITALIPKLISGMGVKEEEK